ncbi:hypothetical protein L484_017338 [Morus notabilis]|uniref:Uncharacterized protein n=1 Tax=Morus notabilis TaxID=981085 RepID=W9S593_9ROSA|nr:hypothetical protein L484_017338 [Morus notabilis]
MCNRSRSWTLWCGTAHRLSCTSGLPGVKLPSTWTKSFPISPPISLTPISSSFLIRVSKFQIFQVEAEEQPEISEAYSVSAVPFFAFSKRAFLSSLATPLSPIVLLGGRFCGRGIFVPYARRHDLSMPEGIIALGRASRLGSLELFVSILDVASLKPDGDKSAYFSQDAGGSIFCTSKPMVVKKNEASSSPSKSFSPNEKDSACETSHRSSCKRSNAESKDSASANESSNIQPCPLVFELKHDTCGACHTQISQGPKRKGDIEFSLQMEMAISATAVGIVIGSRL